MFCICVFVLFFFFKQKTAYEMRISDWSSDVCARPLPDTVDLPRDGARHRVGHNGWRYAAGARALVDRRHEPADRHRPDRDDVSAACEGALRRRTEEHTYELQSLMRNSYAVFCLKKKNIIHQNPAILHT